MRVSCTPAQFDDTPLRSQCQSRWLECPSGPAHPPPLHQPPAKARRADCASATGSTRFHVFNNKFIAPPVRQRCSRCCYINPLQTIAEAHGGSFYEKRLVGRIVDEWWLLPARPNMSQLRLPFWAAMHCQVTFQIVLCCGRWWTLPMAPWLPWSGARSRNKYGKQPACTVRHQIYRFYSIGKFKPRFPYLLVQTIHVSVLAD